LITERPVKGCPATGCKRDIANRTCGTGGGGPAEAVAKKTAAPIPLTSRRRGKARRMNRIERLSPPGMLITRLGGKNTPPRWCLSSNRGGVRELRSSLAVVAADR